MKRYVRLVSIAFLVALIPVLVIRCASTRTSVDFYVPVQKNLLTENYAKAVEAIDAARKQGEYAEKDRVLYYLDKGITLYYMGKSAESITYLEKAEKAMEELFTKSISKAAVSFVLNDNALDYFGEIYENLYVNIFKALNFIKLNKFDGAYVEVKRVNDKLRELDVKYGEMARKMNESEEAKGKMEYKSINFYNDALADYLSYLIFRADGEEDNSRISFDKMQKAFEMQPHIYDYPFPKQIKLRKPVKRNDPNTYLNLIAFVGRAPFKYEVGGKITTYDDYISITDLEMPLNIPNIYWPGIGSGYHFKFSFPALTTPPSRVDRVLVFINGKKAGRMHLLEDMGKVAAVTFESNRDMIILKTILRTVAKGIVAAEAKKKLRKETKADGLAGFLMDMAVDIAVDATENADLRCWRTMPQFCYVAEYDMPKGEDYRVEVHFVDRNGQLISRKVEENYSLSGKLNLIDAVSLN
ncbi:MAG TPA: hypothetical protein ENK44_12460 [Caldithrix abyssi]|uniref:Uncharacterized protein n=1 Tax=Caldithrix abyssi TaxID=187145 RepID=A0A7V4U253_CALAY|nr:hypothetical protein [Caldithrix abyssi]